jgi:hypothetical protein
MKSALRLSHMQLFAFSLAGFWWGGGDAIALKDELDHLTLKLKTWCTSCCFTYHLSYTLTALFLSYLTVFCDHVVLHPFQYEVKLAVFLVSFSCPFTAH